MDIFLNEMECWRTFKIDQMDAWERGSEFLFKNWIGGRKLDGSFR